MRRADRKRPSESDTTSPRRTSAGYTAEQRAQLRRGLRILARMIVRAHLRGEIPRKASPPPKPPSREGVRWVSRSWPTSMAIHLPQGGVARDTRYMSLETPVRFPRLDGGATAKSQ